MVEKYDVFELSLDGIAIDKPFINGKVEAVFICSNEEKKVKGFYDGGNIYRVRFMPSYEGEYTYKVTGNVLKNEVTGSFKVAAAALGNHGPVRVANKYHFTYDDGEVFIPMGTTCYAWVHQPGDMPAKTISSLAASPFNKIRMCIFPKHYVFNQVDPALYPFPLMSASEDSEKPENSKYEWNYDEFNTLFFRNIEHYVEELGKLGIEADLILFHPYDKWGFASLSSEVNDRYLEYMVARFAAYRNVWWSLANEYDFVETKSLEDWNHYGELIAKEDVYHHLIGVHNGVKVYDGSKKWLTHVSVQNQEVREYAKLGKELREKYDKPVIFDEVGYEGNINAIWGCLSPQNFLWRCYEAVMGGAYVTHGETFYSDNEDLWWSHGGVLKGETPARLQFMKEVLGQLPGNGLKPVEMVWDDTAAAAEEDDGVMLFYYGLYRPVCREFYKLDENCDYHVELIDTWNMTIEDKGIKHGHFWLDMPGKEWMLVKTTRY